MIPSKTEVLRVVSLVSATWLCLFAFSLVSQAASQPAPVPSAQPVASPSPLAGHLNDTLEFDHIEGSTLFFKTPDEGADLTSLKTSLGDLKYLGKLKPPASDPAVPPYFLFEARPCSQCEQEKEIFVFKANDNHPSAYVFPGKILDRRSRAVVLQSRAFFGRCLPRHKEQALVVFQKEKIDRRRYLQSSVITAEPGEDHLNERLIERRLPRLKDTLWLVKHKFCHEISGMNRYSLRRPLDVDLSRNAQDLDNDQHDEDQASN